jgi:hypothetical protein
MSLKEKTTCIENRINGLIEAIIKDYYKHWTKNDVSIFTIDIERGTKYYKLVNVDIYSSPRRESRFVHAFVSRETGAVYKPASYKAPAKHVRYNLLDDESYEKCLAKADWAGSYLYKDYT